MDDDAQLQKALGDAYELRGQIGRGGFAVVYAAFDRALKREVAIKVLRSELETPVFRARFRREAETVARLRHPHIVPIFAVGEGEGVAWIVMPLVGGQSLRQRLAREGRLSADETLRILLESAGALAAAHREGILHRDIKPDNIMLEGPEQRVVLMDFGIAKALAGGARAGGADETTGLTPTGLLLGTPQYMSPEQLDGEDPMDHRADLYALGVVGYQMVVGETPFRTASGAAPPFPRQLIEDPPPLEDRQPDCPPALAAAIMRCLARRPIDRWPSADALVRALRVAGGATGMSLPMSPAPHRATLDSPLRRFRRLALGGAGVLVALAAVDIARRTVLLAPLGLLIVLFVLAHRFGSLWLAGFTWRHVLGLEPETATSPTPTGRGVTPSSQTSGSGARYEPTVQRARGSRAAILVLVSRMPRAEQATLADVGSVVDQLLARTDALARQLAAIDQRSDPAATAALTSRLGDARDATRSSGRKDHVAALEQQRGLLMSRDAQRAKVADHLEACLTSMEVLRAALDAAVSAGLAERHEEVTQALERAASCASET